MEHKNLLTFTLPVTGWSEFGARERASETHTAKRSEGTKAENRYSLANRGKQTTRDMAPEQLHAKPTIFMDITCDVVETR